MAATANGGQMSPADWGRLVLLGGLWGGSFFFAKIAVTEMHPLVLVFWRVFLAALALHAYLRIAGIAFRPAVDRWRMILLLGVLNNAVPFSLIFAGQTQIGAGLASVLNATTPFWTLLLASVATSDEVRSWRKLGGIALGIAGTAIVFAPGLEAGLEAPLWSKLALIGASISYAVALMVARRLRDLPPATMAAGQLTASSLVMAPVALAAGSGGSFLGASASTWAAVIALALASTAFAYLLYFRLVSAAGATNASLVTMLVPVSAILLGALFLGERLHATEAIGFAVILTGLLVVDGRIFSSRRPG
jgi:drug/metabolite transporter (DMT)-like permease